MTDAETYSQFRTIAFIDSNVALECLSLGQLPWREIDPIGPILVLFTPTVLREVDGKKNHARLGDHARRFNALLRPLVANANTVVLRASPSPRVEAALAECLKISWDLFPDLDESEADSRIVAEALHVKNLAGQVAVFISQDIFPLNLARQHNLKVHHIGESWLRPKEITEAERKVVALNKEVSSLKSREPTLTLTWAAVEDSVEVYRLLFIDPVRRQEIERTILRLNPMPQQEHGNPLLVLNDYDYSMDRRYERYAQEIVPNFVRQYESKLEMLFGQLELVLTVQNPGKVQAESLLLEIKVTGGWMNEKFVWVSPGGPPPPRIKRNTHLSLLASAPNWSLRTSQLQRGRHDLAIELGPERSQEVNITCNDFRHGASYEYRVVVWADPRSASDLSITAVATAGNLHGESRETLTIKKQVTDIDVGALLDMKSLELIKPSGLKDRLQKAILAKDFSRFEADGADWDK